MEAPLHRSPVALLPPPPPPPPPAQRGSFLQQQAASGREPCPRCASRDTKFCYYNNYNTAQPRHFCRSCRRYWTLGGSLRNVPVGGATRKRRRQPARCRAVARRASPGTGIIGAGPLLAGSPAALAAPPPPPPAAALLQGAGRSAGGLFLSSLLLGSAPASAPLLEGRLGFDLGLGQPAGAAAADLQLALLLGLGAGPLPWPATVLEGDPAETTASWEPGAAAAQWQELAGAHLLLM